jgi:hypothetical protein
MPNEPEEPMTDTSNVMSTQDTLLAQRVDDALSALAQAQGTRAACQQALDLADQDVRKAMADVEHARDALFEEHPELAGSGASSPAPDPAAAWEPGRTQTVPEGLNPAAFDPEVIEVDDDNDTRFTGGGGPAPSPDDDAPLPPVVWAEHDE